MNTPAPLLGIERLAFPLARLLMRSDVTWAMLAEELKRVFVLVAANEMSLTARDSSKSRIAMLTGLSRREVARILDDEISNQRPAGMDREVSACARTISVWRTDTRFLTQDGYPRALANDDSKDGFRDLVRAINRDLPPRVIERELVTNETVRVDDDGLLHLNARAFVGLSDEQAAWELLGTDIAMLLETIAHNFAAEEAGDRRFQRKVFFRNLSPKGVERLHQIASEQGQALLEEIDNQLVTEDNSHAGGRFAGLSIHLFERASGRTQDKP